LCVFTNVVGVCNLLKIIDFRIHSGRVMAVRHVPDTLAVNSRECES
jgi:hypothetical protein